MADKTSGVTAESSPRPRDADSRLLLAEPLHLVPAICPEASALCCITSTCKSPKDASFTFEYLNKGAANAVFTINPSSIRILETVSTAPVFQLVTDLHDTTRGFTARPVPREFTVDKVLRVPRGKAKTPSGETILSSFHDMIKPLFGPALQGLTPAQMSGLAITTNNKIVPATLRSMQGNLGEYLMDHQGILLFPNVMQNLRSLVDKDVFVELQASSPPEPRWAILLENMSPVANQSITLEIKPKWLLQSPNAPPEAIRCRTCAMQVVAPKDRASYICPLRLLHGTPNDIRPWLHTRISTLMPHACPTPARRVDHVASHLCSYFTSGVGRALLLHLAFLQSKLDPAGVLAQDPTATAPHSATRLNLRAAMTLRDCSLFIRVEVDPATGVPSTATSRLGDLDFKAAEKIADWAGKERRLLAEDAYTAGLEDELGCWVPRLGV